MSKNSTRLAIFAVAVITAVNFAPARADTAWNFGDAPPTNNFNETLAKYEKNLNQYYKDCNKSAFDHDLQNLAALADMMAQAASRELDAETRSLSASGNFPTQASLNAKLDRERGNAQAGKASPTNYGAAYADSVIVNKALADYRSYDWSQCKEAAKRTSMSTTIGVDYAHFSPSSGSDGNQYGLSGNVLFPLGDNFGLNLDAGYHNVSSTGPSLDNWTVGASGVLSEHWTGSEWRIGPSFGFQSNSVGSFTSNTYNYGGYADYFASQTFTISAKGGGFSSSPGSDGYYLGGNLKGYVNPNFAINGAIDYTRFTSFGGASETDYTLQAEWKVSQTTPISIYGGYTYSGFSPGSFNVNTVFVGLKLYTNGDGADTLIDRQRSGPIGWSGAFAPLSLKF